MEKYLNLWDLERLVRQYVGFNEQVIKEYHANFGAVGDQVWMKPTAETNGRTILMLQWRSIAFVEKLGFDYIYTFKPFVQRKNDKRVLSIMSLPAMLFKDNAYRASTLR